MEQLERVALKSLGIADPYAPANPTMSDDQGRSPDGPPTESAGQQPDIVARLRAALFGALGLRQNGSARAEIEDAIAADEAAGATLTADERAMLRAILKLGDMRVEDVMMPRADIEAIDIESVARRGDRDLPRVRPFAHAGLSRDARRPGRHGAHPRPDGVDRRPRAGAARRRTAPKKPSFDFAAVDLSGTPGGFEAGAAGALRAALDAGARAAEAHAVEPHADGARHRRIWRHRRPRLARGSGRDHRRRDRGRARPRRGADGEEGRRGRLTSPTRAPSSTTRRR